MIGASGLVATRIALWVGVQLGGTAFAVATGMV